MVYAPKINVLACVNFAVPAETFASSTSRDYQGNIYSAGPLTKVITLKLVLHIAPISSEDVACAMRAQQM